jgi:hypothetical protein
MKIVKILLVLLAVYVGIVVIFESLIGYFQPQGETTLVITTTDANGDEHRRVLASLETDGKLYVAANHWPRGWYNQVLENPDVKVEINGTSAAYVAVPVSAAEHDRIQAEHPLGPVIRFLTGYPPRHFVRLEPLNLEPGLPS